MINLAVINLKDIFKNLIKLFVIGAILIFIINIHFQATKVDIFLYFCPIFNEININRTQSVSINEIFYASSFCQDN